MIKVTKGLLVQYALATPPMFLQFEFNPSSITRTRSITVNTGSTPATRGGYDFDSKSETPRASQGVNVNTESFTVKILLDATDRMNVKDPVAMTEGVQPEIDTIQVMLAPKTQSPEGVQTLSSLGKGEARAFSHHESASVLLFVWGTKILPVFMTQAQIDEKEYLPNLYPYRAEATLTLQIIESTNPFYNFETARQLVSASKYSVTTAASVIKELF